MAGFDDPAFYGDRWAAVYDNQHAQMDPGPAVDFLSALSGDGRVLELAIGTGRVALPLAARGISVEGVDTSAAMVEQLRAKPGGESIPVTIGDMAEVPVSGPFRLVYLVFNTLFGLLSQARQAECFASVAHVLGPGGMFVVECFVPTLAGSTGTSESRSVPWPKTPRSSSCPVTTRRSSASPPRSSRWMGKGCSCGPVALRYSWPSELDLMAERPGLRLLERHSSWDRQPFTNASSTHVSVYQRA